jgi:PAS domain S-box-containing protein
LTPLRALVIEDSVYDAELVVHELTQNGYELQSERVDSAELLQAALDRQTWDVILCDYNLPGFGAMQALEIVKGRGIDAPLIVLSGSIGEEAVVEALKAGALDCVLKSNMPRLIPVLRRALSETELVRRQSEAERQLREGEERLQLALEAGRIMIWDIDVKTQQVVCTGSGLGSPGLEPEDFVSYEYFLDAVHPDDRERVGDGIASWLEGGGPDELEFRFVAHDGSIHWVANRALLVRDDDGTPVRMLGISPDITARKQAEEELRNSNVLLEALLNSSPVAIAATDLERRLTIWNSAAERMFGWRRDEVLGKPSPLVPPELSGELEALFERLDRGEDVVDFETRRRCKDATLVDVSISLALLRGSEGRPSGSIGVFADVTDRKRSREELQRSLELLRTANEERRRLLERLVRAQEEERQRIAADIHDDSVQALTALALRLGIAAGQTTDPATAQTFRNAERQTQTAIERLRRLMFELRPPALDRDGLVEALRLYLDETRSQHGLEVGLESSLAGEPSEETRAVIYRIAQEAVVNVTKHARATRLDVSIEERAGGIWVSVKDDGRGFLPDRAKTQVGHVGLDSMRERAELAGGWWKIHSGDDDGTTVEFFLPARVEVVV